MVIKQNPETGIAEVYEDGKKVGEIITMGDVIIAETNAEDEEDEVTKKLREKFGL